MSIKQTKYYIYLSNIKKKIYQLGYRAMRLVFPVKLLWKLFAQNGELEFHKRNEWRQTSDFMAHSKKLMLRMGYQENSFQDKVIVDMGNGSKLRSKFFKDSKIIAIDPLNDDFRNNIEWSDVVDAYKCYSVPAEEMIDEIVGIADFVLCINVLDHTYNPRKVLENIHAYLKDDSEFFLSVDLNHIIPNSKHPFAFSDKSIRQLLDSVGFIIKDYAEGVSDQDENNFGSGDGGAASYISHKK